MSTVCCCSASQLCTNLHCLSYTDDAAANSFPAGAVDKYLAEGWARESNITIDVYRAPRSIFIGGAEQSFLDEVAVLAGKDPIAFRLELRRVPGTIQWARTTTLMRTATPVS